MARRDFRSFYQGSAAAFAILAFLVTLPSVCAHASEENKRGGSSIVVTATGESQAVPDMAIISLAVVTRDKTAQKALEANNKSVNNVMNSFKKNGIQANDLQTSGLSIHQVMSNKRDDGDDEKLYQVSNSLTVRVRFLPDAGKIFDQAMALGINSVSGVTFVNADPKPFYREARRKAITEAIEQAETLAQAANLNLGKITEVYEVNSGSHRVLNSAASLETEDYENTNLSGGELNYNVTVNVTFSVD